VFDNVSGLYGLLRFDRVRMLSCAQMHSCQIGGLARLDRVLFVQGVFDVDWKLELVSHLVLLLHVGVGVIHLVLVALPVRLFALVCVDLV